MAPFTFKNIIVIKGNILLTPDKLFIHENGFIFLLNKAVRYFTWLPRLTFVWVHGFDIALAKAKDYD